MSTVQAYFQQLMGAARQFSSQRNFPVSVCAKFQDGLDPRLQTGYQWYFPQHSLVQSLNGTHQRKTLQAMLQAAQQAKDDLHAIQRVACEAGWVIPGISCECLGRGPSWRECISKPGQKNSRVILSKWWVFTN